MEEKVLAALQSKGEPMRPGEVADATGIDKVEVTKIISKLVKEGKVESPKRCFYAPKK